MKDVLLVVLAVFSFMSLLARAAIAEWKDDRFDARPGSDVVRVKTKAFDENAEPLWICADVVNGHFKNCLSADEVAEAARAKWRTNR